MLYVLVILCLGLGARIARTQGWRNGTLWTFALLSLAIACVDPPLPWRGRPVVALLVDLSPSTRGLWFRSADAIRSIRDALPSTDVRTFGFADGSPRFLEPNTTPAELSADRTSLPPMDADAVVLLSDGQFEMTASRPPVFAVVDDDAATPADARIESASLQQGELTASVRSDSAGRELVWPDGVRERVDPGTRSLRHVSLTTGDASISLSPGDRWPENDRIDVASSQPPLRFLWLGRDAAEGFEAADIGSIDLAALSQCGSVVLNDLPIDSIPLTLQQDLARYVRDFGGSLLIGGGPSSLSAGGYGNTVLDSLSPLASLPPTPTNDLFIIVDSSGSMASPTASGQTKLEIAVDAMRAIDRIVPPTWSVRAGSVARDLRWWPGDRERVKPPGDLNGSGPTNLAAAIRAVVDAPSDHPKRLILLSDGQVEPSTLNLLSPGLLQKPVVIDWLALPPADTNGALARLVHDSGGTILAAADATQWRARAEGLARGAMSAPMLDGPFPIALPNLGTLSVSRVNTVHLRERATSLAAVDANGSSWPVAATWNVGLGRVTTLAFAAPPGALAALAKDGARQTHDPRFTLHADTDALEVLARDENGPMNRLPLSVRIDAASSPLPQIGPGKYRVELARSSHPRIATVALNGLVIDNAIIPSRYAREFESIGIDRPRLEALSKASGGKVLDRSGIREIRSLLPRKPGPGVRLPALVLGFALLCWVLVESRLRAGR